MTESGDDTPPDIVKPPARTLGAATRLCAVIGNPVRHSLSPAIHNAGYAALGLDMAYLAFEVHDVGAALTGMRALGIRGLSVTIPHKVAVIDHLDELDPVARRIGAVNTVTLEEDGRLTGRNTDGSGALQALREAGRDPAGRDVLLLGAGGSARALAFTLALEGGARGIEILARRPERARALADAVGAAGPSEVRGAALDDATLRGALERCSIMLHTTPLGMTGHPGSPLPADALTPGHTVFDIVYTPLETELIRAARERGADVILGVEMFLGQAARQFELWTGRAAPLDVMRETVLVELAAREEAS